MSTNDQNIQCFKVLAFQRSHTSIKHDARLRGSLTLFGKKCLRLVWSCITELGTAAFGCLFVGFNH